MTEPLARPLPQDVRGSHEPGRPLAPLLPKRQFTPINKRYVEAQCKAVGQVRKGGRLDGLFVWVVSLYPGLLLALTGFVWGYVWSR